METVTISPQAVQWEVQHIPVPGTSAKRVIVTITDILPLGPPPQGMIPLKSYMIDLDEELAAEIAKKMLSPTVHLAKPGDMPDAPPAS